MKDITESVILTLGFRCIAHFLKYHVYTQLQLLGSEYNICNEKPMSTPTDLNLNNVNSLIHSFYPRLDISNPAPFHVTSQPRETPRCSRHTPIQSHFRYSAREIWQLLLAASQYEIRPRNSLSIGITAPFYLHSIR